MGSRTTSMQILAPRHAALGGWVAVTPNLCQTRAPRRPSPSDAHAATAPALYPAGCARPTTPIRFQQRRRYPSAPSVLTAPRVFCAHSLSLIERPCGSQAIFYPVFFTGRNENAAAETLQRQRGRGFGNRKELLLPRERRAPWIPAQPLMLHLGRNCRFPQLVGEAVLGTREPSYGVSERKAEASARGNR